ncbi:MAG: hypothetical protein ABSB69_16030 [Solirubrobacteraceae bacterium]
MGVLVQHDAHEVQEGSDDPGAEGPASNTVGNDLRPHPGEAFATFSCAGTPVTVMGSVIGEAKRNAMSTKATLKFAQSNGVQSATRFEGGEEDVLLTQLGEGGAVEHSGLSLATNQASEEKVEINSVF